MEITLITHMTSELFNYMLYSIAMPQKIHILDITTSNYMLSWLSQVAVKCNLEKYYRSKKLYKLSYFFYFLNGTAMVPFKIMAFNIVLGLNKHCIHVIVVTQAGVHCLICTHDARGRAAPEGKCVYISQCNPACVTTNMLHFKSQLSR